MNFVFAAVLLAIVWILVGWTGFSTMIGVAFFVYALLVLMARN
jgi:hypothetical protein